MIWLIQKLENVASNIPKELDAEQAQRKLIKIILGVVLHVNDELMRRRPFRSVRRDLMQLSDWGIHTG